MTKFILMNLQNYSYRNGLLLFDTINKMFIQFFHFYVFFHLSAYVRHTPHSIFVLFRIWKNYLRKMLYNHFWKRKYLNIPECIQTVFIFASCAANKLFSCVLFTTDYFLYLYSRILFKEFFLNTRFISIQIYTKTIFVSV